MPYLVNGQLVTEELIREEFERIARDPQWQNIPDLTERARRLRAAAVPLRTEDRPLIRTPRMMFVRAERRAKSGAPAADHEHVI